MKSCLVAAVSLAVLAGPALAQDVSAPPTYGSVSLSSGFTPDPYTVDLTSGGQISAQTVSGSCRGWIADAPDFSVQYSAGNMFDLTIAAVSGSDTTLVINDPNGNWYCDDDGGEGLNPLLTFSNPRSGRYDIWVGSYSEGDYASATLSVSELGTAADGSGNGGYDGGYGSGGSIDWTLPANYGSASLQAGFTPDPYRVNVVAGGSRRADEARSGCAGWVSSAPDFELQYSAGSSLPLILSAASSSDTTILVNDPNGNWHCDDDGGNSGLNPALTFHNPPSGTYDIWIGAYSQGDSPAATLSISELYSE